jgi:uncharacterized protein (TIGR00369 family)
LKFVPPNPDFEARTRESFGRQGVMALLGARLERVEPGLVEISLDYRPELSQQHGFFHAGVLSTIADSAAGYAAFTLFPPDAAVLTVEYKINLMAACRRREAHGHRAGHPDGSYSYRVPLRRARREAGRRTHCATGLETLIALQGRAGVSG